MACQQQNVPARADEADELLRLLGCLLRPAERWLDIEDLWERAAQLLRLEYRRHGRQRMLLWRDFARIACQDIGERLAAMASYDLYAVGGVRSPLQQITLVGCDLTMVLIDRPRYLRCEETFELHEAIDRFLQRIRRRPVGWR